MAVAVYVFGNVAKEPKTAASVKSVCWLWYRSPDFEAASDALSSRNSLLFLSSLASEDNELILKHGVSFFSSELYRNICLIFLSVNDQPATFT